MSDSRVIRVSSKRQITIPQEYANKIGLGDEVECILRDGEIVIKKLIKFSDLREDRQPDDFSDLIRKDLEALGYTGEALEVKTKEIRLSLKPAARKMLADTVADVRRDNRDWRDVHNGVFAEPEIE